MAHIMVAADGMVAATIGRAPMHIMAELAMRVVELATPAVALPAEPVAASMVVADVAEWFE